MCTHINTCTTDAEFSEEFVKQSQFKCFKIFLKSIKMLQKDSCHLGILYPVKISFKGKDELTFSAKQKLSNFIPIPNFKERQRESDFSSELKQETNKKMKSHNG